MNSAPDIVVSVRDLEKKFGDFTAVNKVNFEVRRGEIFGFLGPNGAGKSTTIRMLCGIYAPTSGSGTVGGFDIIREQGKIKENIGYMSQKFSLYDDLTVEENIDFYSGIYNIPYDKRQERKEEVIAASLLHDPTVLFLDEPTSGVDPITRASFWAIIKDLAHNGVTVFVTTHYMDEAENCDRMVLIYHGTIIAMGTSVEMKTRFMKNDVLEIVVDAAKDWIDGLDALEMVKEAALFGANIHAVVYEAARAIPALKAYLASKGANVREIRKIVPSLEDVFVSAIENYDKEHAS